MNQKRKRWISLCFTLAFILCLAAHESSAAGIDEINPDVGFEFAIVLQGQSTGSISTTSATAFDLLNVGLVSVGNSSLTATLNMNSQQTVVWWVSLVSIGRTIDSDFVFGFAPLSGFSAQVAVDPTIGFALATAGVISAVPVTVDDPLEYSVIVTGQP